MRGQIREAKVRAVTRATAAAAAAAAAARDIAAAPEPLGEDETDLETFKFLFARMYSWCGNMSMQGHSRGSRRGGQGREVTGGDLGRPAPPHLEHRNSGSVGAGGELAVSRKKREGEKRIVK